MNANMLSKHISRLFCLNSTTRRVDSVPKWCLPPKRYLHQDPKADPNPIVASGETGTKFSFKTKFALWSLAGLGTLGYVFYVKNKKDMIQLKRRQVALAKSTIDGAWELVDCDGKVYHSEDFLGKWCLIYFGFTHCPDICPDEMAKLAGAVDDLAKQNMEVKPIFISIDPERDTKEVVGKYVKEFSPKILGLTGETEQIVKAGQAFHVYFKAGPKDKDNDYIVDHTIIIYLVDPKGQFIEYYGLSKTREQIATSVIGNRIKWERLNNPSWLGAISLKWDEVRNSGWFENK